MGVPGMILNHTMGRFMSRDTQEETCNLKACGLLGRFCHDCFTFSLLHESQIKHEEQQPEMVVGKVNHYFVSRIQESKCRCIFKPKDTKTHGQRIIVGLLNPLVLIYQAAANFFVAFRFTRRRLDENKHFWLRGLFSERESSV